MRMDPPHDRITVFIKETPESPLTLLPWEDSKKLALMDQEVMSHQTADRWHLDPGHPASRQWRLSVCGVLPQQPAQMKTPTRALKSQ